MVLPLFNPLSAEISQMKLVPNKRDPLCQGRRENVPARQSKTVPPNGTVWVWKSPGLWELRASLLT